MNKQDLHKLILKKQSFLCVGLDTDINLIPKHLLQFPDPVFEFNKAIIDATRDFCVAYKPNIAFYESLGVRGWESLEKTMNYLELFKDEVFTIADAKRGDIGNSSKMYAKAYFEWLNFDAVTVAPYMGEDSVTPFLGYHDKWVILLGLTSNKGSSDFQFQKIGKERLYEKVIKVSQKWTDDEQMMYVTGATHPEEFKNLRGLAPKHFFLVPGVGAQGGDLHAICQNAMNDQCGLLINSARNIIYASGGEDYAEAAKKEAVALQQEMKKYLNPIGSKD